MAKYFYFVLMGALLGYLLPQQVFSPSAEAPVMATAPPIHERLTPDSSRLSLSPATPPVSPEEPRDESFSTGEEKGFSAQELLMAIFSLFLSLY